MVKGLSNKWRTYLAVWRRFWEPWALWKSWGRLDSPFRWMKWGSRIRSRWNQANSTGFEGKCNCSEWILWLLLWWSTLKNISLKICTWNKKKEKRTLTKDQSEELTFIARMGLYCNLDLLKIIECIVGLHTIGSWERKWTWPNWSRSGRLRIEKSSFLLFHLSAKVLLLVILQWERAGNLRFNFNAPHSILA